jgi:hypothetical protein
MSTPYHAGGWGDHALVELKGQLQASEPPNVVAETMSKLEGLLTVRGARPLVASKVSGAMKDVSLKRKSKEKAMSAQ